MARILKALIVDDERLARRDLASLLAAFPDVQVVGEAEDVPSAAQAVTAWQPDVVFLDIQMPGPTGFELLDAIPPSVQIVFVTAYDEYAIRAFEVNALDYLLKPVNPERLRRALERLEHEVRSRTVAGRQLAYHDRLFLLLNTHHRFLRIDTILCISAAGDYTEVSTSDGRKWLASKALREWEARLPQPPFCRIHRSAIVNLNFVDHTEQGPDHAYRLVLRGIAEPLVVSRRFAAQLKNRFG